MRGRVQLRRPDERGCCTSGGSGAEHGSTSSSGTSRRLRAQRQFRRPINSQAGHPPAYTPWMRRSRLPRQLTAALSDEYHPQLARKPRVGRVTQTGIAAVGDRFGIAAAHGAVAAARGRAAAAATGHPVTSTCCAVSSGAAGWHPASRRTGRRCGSSGTCSDYRTRRRADERGSGLRDLQYGPAHCRQTGPSATPRSRTTRRSCSCRT